MTLTWKMEVYIGSSWTDISSDVLADSLVKCDWGLSGNKFSDRMAKTGSMRFKLKNSTGKYSPDHASALAGWTTGLKVKLTITFDTVEYIKFIGRIESFGIDAGTLGSRRVSVMVSDWMRETTDYPLTLASLETNKYADAGITTIVNRLPTAPADTEFENGDNLFPTLFDTVTTKTRAYSEINKIITSELGYCYLKKDKLTGETLIFENSSHRNGTQALSFIPKLIADCGVLETEVPETILTEDGLDIILDEVQTPTFDNTMISASVDYGNNVINYANVTAYPKLVDTNIQVLYSLNQPQAIGAGQTITIKGNYSDPSGGNSVNVQSTTMLTPVINTDYKIWSNSDGTGTDLTTDMAITVVYGTEGMQYTLTNGSATSGYVTLLQARGYGIYSYDKLYFEENDTASQVAYGYSQDNLNQVYKQDLYEGVLTARTLVEMEKDPRTDLRKVSFWNRTDTMTLAFLNLDVGDIISIQEDQTGTNGYYYIQAVEFELHPKGHIMFSWIVRQFFCLAAGLSLLAVEFAPNPSTNLIEYGYIPAINSTQVKKSISFWVYVHSQVASGVNQSYSIVGNNGVLSYPGYFLDLERASDGIGGYANELWFGQTTNVDGTFGIAWHADATTNPTPLNTWVNYVFTSDLYTINNAPVLYYEGSVIPMTQSGTATGSLASMVGSPLWIGGVPDYQYAYTMDGQIADVRIYNRILTAAEAAQIHSEGIGGTGVTNGLIFQGPAVKTSKLADYVDTTLTSSMKLLDTYKYRVGTPSGSPIGRAIP